MPGGARIVLHPQLARRAACGVPVLLTPEDVAEIIQRPVRYVRDKLLVTGKLPAMRFGKRSWRIRASDLEGWMKKRARDDVY